MNSEYCFWCLCTFFFFLFLFCIWFNRKKSTYVRIAFTLQLQQSVIQIKHLSGCEWHSWVTLKHIIILRKCNFLSFVTFCCSHFFLLFFSICFIKLNLSLTITTYRLNKKKKLSEFSCFDWILRFQYAICKNLLYNFVFLCEWKVNFIRKCSYHGFTTSLG